MTQIIPKIRSRKEKETLGQMNAYAIAKREEELR